MQRSAPVVLKGDHDVLGIWENELSPSLPERVHNVGYEPNLTITITMIKMALVMMMMMVTMTMMTMTIIIMITVTLNIMTI